MVSAGSSPVQRFISNPVRGLRDFAFGIGVASSLVVVVLLLATGSVAQTNQGSAPVTKPRFADPAQITMQHLEHGLYETRARIVQDRLSYSETGVWGFRESVTLEGAPGHRFAVDLHQVLGSAIFGAVRLEVNRVAYLNHCGFLHRYHSFGISDATLAAQNYFIHFFQEGLWNDRPTYWISVVSRSAGKSSWLLQLDQETAYPLYRGEYSGLGLLCSEVRVREFECGAGLVLAPTQRWWQPTNYDVQEFVQPSAALLAFDPHLGFIPSESVIPSTYQLRGARVTTSLLNGRRTLVFDCTDGIDHVFLSEHDLPPVNSSPPPLDEGHRIEVYADLNVTQCRFQDRRLECMVVGHGFKSLIQDTAKTFYLEALRR